MLKACGKQRAAAQRLTGPCRTMTTRCGSVFVGRGRAVQDLCGAEPGGTIISWQKIYRVKKEIINAYHSLIWNLMGSCRPDEIYLDPTVPLASLVSHRNFLNYLTDSGNKKGMRILEIGSREVTGKSEAHQKFLKRNMSALTNTRDRTSLLSGTPTNYRSTSRGSVSISSIRGRCLNTSPCLGLLQLK